MPVAHPSPPSARLKGSAVRRALRLLPGLWAALIGVGAARAESLPSSEPLAWARSYYLGAAFCSVAEIAEVVDRPPVIVVRLTIDPRWAKDLGRMAADLRSDWFALHCPFILEPIWGLLPPGGDVVVEAPVPGLGVVRHGCRPPPAASGG